jgi:hypothetical protein
MRNLKRSLTLLLASLTLISSLAFASGSALAWNPFHKVCTEENGVNVQTSTVCNTSSKDPITGAEKQGILIKAANIISVVVGVAGTIFIIIAGIQMITSTGDPQKVSRARDTIIYVAVGIVVTLMGQVIIRFVINKL